jgi:hypothetical protein
LKAPGQKPHVPEMKPQSKSLSARENCLEEQEHKSHYETWSYEARRLSKLNEIEYYKEHSTSK